VSVEAFYAALAKSEEAAVTNPSAEAAAKANADEALAARDALAAQLPSACVDRWVARRQKQLGPKEFACRYAADDEYEYEQDGGCAVKEMAAVEEIQDVQFCSRASALEISKAAAAEAQRDETRTAHRSTQGGKRAKVASVVVVGENEDRATEAAGAAAAGKRREQRQRPMDAPRNVFGSAGKQRLAEARVAVAARALAKADAARSWNEGTPCDEPSPLDVLNAALQKATEKEKYVKCSLLTLTSLRQIEARAAWLFEVQSYA